MDHGGFVVQGSRPPSVQSSHRPSPARSKHGYHTVSYQSSVDETLFSSHHPTKIHDSLNDFQAPWECSKPKPMGKTFVEQKTFLLKEEKNKKKPKIRPLLWAPMLGTTTHTYLKKKEKKNSSSQSSFNNMSQFWNTRDQFRHLKHTDTFVDESLFGKKLEEPSFEAPWNEKKEKFQLDLKHTKYYRPKTALGFCSGNRDVSKAVPVWKP